MATLDRSCSGSNPATPPPPAPVEAPQSIDLIPETPESSMAVLTDLTPATPIEGALEGSTSGHVHATALYPSPAGSGGPQHQDTPLPGKGAKRKRSGRK